MASLQRFPHRRSIKQLQQHRNPRNQLRNEKTCYFAVHQHHLRRQTNAQLKIWNQVYEQGKVKQTTHSHLHQLPLQFFMGHHQL